MRTSTLFTSTLLSILLGLGFKKNYSPATFNGSFDRSSDSLALIEFFDSTGGSTTWDITISNTWNFDHPMDTYAGVALNANGRVRSIELINVGLSGKLPQSIGNLSLLDYLELMENKGLSGGIPDTIGALSQLTELRLGNTTIGDSIPLSIGRLTSLTDIALFGCDLTGTIPDTLRNLSQLEVLDLTFNNLTDGIPTWIGDLDSLAFLRLGSNSSLGDTIPKELGNLSKLVNLTLNGCGLTGEIPNELNGLIRLRELKLGDNYLEGEVPVFWGALPELERLEINDNLLVGSIPSSLGQLVNLEYLLLDNNLLTAGIPTELSNLNLLKEFNLCCQKIKGGGLIDTIPSGLGNLTNLYDFQLHNNNLTGSIPSTLGNLTNLVTFRLYDNELTGHIPISLNRLHLLSALDLSSNQLTGTIPDSLGDMTNLTVFDFSDNQLNGTIPSTLSNLNNLVQLDLSNNQLSGVIPTNIEATEMTKLDLSYNQLSDTIPSSIFSASKLVILRLNNNQLIGSIPTPQGLNNLETMLLGNNQLNDTLSANFNKSNLDRIQELRLQNNQISGFIPTGIGDLNTLEILDFTQNELVGDIPFEDNNLSALEAIYLDNNQLSGNLPTAFATYSQLIVLSASGNQLSGTIPEGIGMLPNLKDLYLRGNQLEGCIPQDWFNLCAQGADVSIVNNPLLLNDDFDAFCNATGDGVGVCLTNYECATATILPINEDPCGRNYRAVNLNNASTSVPSPALDSNATFVGNDVWFKVITPSTTNFLIKQDSISTIVPSAEAYKGNDCASLTAIKYAEIDSIPNAFSIRGADYDLMAGDTVWIRIWDQNNSVVDTENAVIALTAHLLPVDKEEWELCDFPAEVLNDTLPSGAGNRIATQFIVQYDETTTSMDTMEISTALRNEGAVLLKECPCGMTPLQLWTSVNPIEMEIERQSARKRSKVDTSNYNYLLEIRDFIGNSFTTGQQLNSAAAIAQNGDFVLTWQDNGRYRYSYNLYGQQFQASGDRDGAEFKVNSSFVGQEIPDVSMRPNGDYIVTWMEGKSLGRKEAKAQLYHADGSKNGDIRAISSPQAAYNPSVASDTAGNFFVAWEAPDANGFGIYGRRFDADGNALAPTAQINTFTNGNQVLPTVAMNARGTFVLVWQGGNQDGSGDGVYGALFQENGTQQGNIFQINTETSGNQGFPNVAMNDAGQFVVVWQSAGQDGTGNGIYAQRFLPSGVHVGNEIAVNTFTTNDQSKPVVAMYQDGGFVVVWESLGQDGSGGGIYLQLFAPDGSKIGGEQLVNTVTSGSQLNPSMAMNRMGNIVVSWESFGQDGDGQGIFGQQFQSIGSGASRTISAINDAKLSAGLGLLQNFPSSTYLPNNPNASVRVAFTDTGIKDDHPELANAIWMNEAQNDADNCLIGDVIGYDFVENNGTPNDIDGHGTGVNGVLVQDFPAAIQLELMNLKFYENQRGTVFDAVCGIYYAIAEGADIINMSWGFESEEFPQILYDALAYAAEKDVLLITSAGNTSRDNDQINKYPANFDLPNLIVATAYQLDEDSIGIRLANYASYGNSTVDLAARGYVETTALGDSLSRLAGTSLAAPSVARAAAILKAKHPTLTAIEIKDCILSSVTLVDGLDSLLLTGGVLNATAALACAEGKEASCRASDFSIEEEQTQNFTYQSTGTIQMNATINAGVEIVIQAADSITLTAGFHAKAGANFHGFIQDCGSPSTLASNTSTQPSAPFIQSDIEEKKTNISSPNILIYPNPTQDEFTVEIKASKKTATQLQIYRFDGVLVKSMRLAGNSAFFKAQIDVSDLEAGIYLLHTRTEGTVRNQQLVILP
ncbi:MAG: S8 family serine peptidase [Bacteroidota bacterium]